MTRPKQRPTRKPKTAAGNPQLRATLVFRDFVRQLEKLDTHQTKATREGSR